MIADESDAVTVVFLRMMRAELRAERVGEDSLGRTVELARRWWGTADAQLADALRELHAEPVDPTEPREGADAPTTDAGPPTSPGPLTSPGPRGAGLARFAANARRLRTGEISPAEFDEIMGADDPDRPTA
ncbi:hypothetical protein ACIBP4_30205 [Micromonospora maritima]|uniref:SHOCT domain-containing protein n=1 Tax=Micromonospora maritima TaxID=986711 RepID=A0ABW7ZUQ9_9ACTN